jgi:2-methylisocitrate lyase-like PEP mutase family enzyme
MSDHALLAEHARILRRLHAGFLVLPNAWDPASAVGFAQLGFAALATTSSGVAESLGYADREQAPTDAMFGALAAITRAVEIPVSADLEAGYRLAPDELVDRLLDAGACGLNLEDSDHYSDAPLVDATEHAARLAAVKAAARQRGVDVVLNGRVDVHLRGVAEGEARLAEAIRRARLYLDAGADCIYPITVGDEPTISAFVGGLSSPVNVLYSEGGPSLARLAKLGVRRVTFGGALQRLGLEPAIAMLSSLGVVSG